MERVPENLRDIYEYLLKYEENKEKVDNEIQSKY